MVRHQSSKALDQRSNAGQERKRRRGLLLSRMQQEFLCRNFRLNVSSMWARSKRNKTNGIGGISLMLLRHTTAENAGYEFLKPRLTKRWPPKAPWTWSKDSRNTDRASRPVRCIAYLCPGLLV